MDTQKPSSKTDIIVESLSRAFAEGLDVGIVTKHGYMSLEEWLIMRYGVPSIEPSGAISSKLAASLLLLALLAVLALAVTQ